MENKTWNSLIRNLPNPHFLQTYEWGQIKARYGWTPLYAIWDADGKWKVASDPGQLSTVHSPVAAALILKRQILRNGFAARVAILYSPKGPLLDWANEALRNRVLDDLQSLAKKQGAIFLKMDPDVVLGKGVPSGGDDVVDSNGQTILSDLKRRGWRYSSDQIQFKNTVLIDLRLSEQELLARMKQKTRYNIRLAQKKGVVLRIGTSKDFEALYQMYAETSVRDGFVIREEGYYQMVWTTFMAKEPPTSSLQSPVSNLQPRVSNLQSPVSNPQSPIPNPQSLVSNLQSLIPNSNSPIPNPTSPVSNSQLPSAEPLIAEVEDEPVAAIFVFYFAGRGYYVYGMSRDRHREKMPAYLLQWEAIKRAKAKGCTVYDLWGAPEVFDQSDSLWGVYRFKEGLGGQVVRTLGAWDFAPNPLWYKLYSQVIPRLLDVMRSRGKARTKQSLGGA